ncbi:selection and upkeep of intraepithelial T-cells protein 1-like [Simochromis diagramma]|uniref:selection and upkeep of intraepithelial T-cells protein 1-like n=1 Tax=Simochromis diagramma TaxID=43689 RepID=UPI001A7E29F0|nr:selection and upkeep of intraepithelial T-cells protein 1-like [Simochromis diagramma]
MSAVTVSLCSTLLFVGLFVFVSAAQKNITAESGENLTLTCQVPNNNIRAVEWSRADLESRQVLLYRDGHFDTTNQHLSFKNRVDLQDRQMKDGDVSLILNNVTINDTGTYECRVFSKERNNKPISSIYLHVDPPGQTGGDTEDGSVGLKVGLSVAAVLLFFAVVAVLIYRKHKKVKKVNYESTCSSQS